MMVRALVAALMLGGCATTGVPAPAAETGALVDRYDEAVLRAIMADLAYAVVDTSENAAGKPFMMVEAGEALAFRVMGESCQGEGAAQVCAGVQLSTQFGETGEADFDEVMATANRTLRPAKLFRAGPGLAYERYLIMDGGVSRENLKTNIVVFVQVLEALYGQLFPD